MIKNNTTNEQLLENADLMLFSCLTDELDINIFGELFNNISSELISDLSLLDLPIAYHDDDIILIQNTIKKLIINKKLF